MGCLYDPDLPGRDVTRDYFDILKQAGLPRGGARGGGEFPWPPTLIGPQLENKSLKLSRFFKLVEVLLKLRAPYSSSTCSLAKV
jgi:hypothetical protein